MTARNIDDATVRGFGDEWSAYDQLEFRGREFDDSFESYFAIFPFDELPPAAEGFDLGCGSGRWAAKVITRVGTLHCIDPSGPALEVARRRLAGDARARFHLASSDSIPLPDSSQDFGYSLGVLHHIPDTARALGDCVRKLKPGAPFLVYLYYALDSRPAWFRFLWKASDVGRRGVSALPFAMRKLVTTAVAASIYWPLARGARLLEQLGMNVRNVPLSAYRRTSFYTMRTDALDRFGTRLEQRFSRSEILKMMEAAGLTQVRFSSQSPFWVACGRRAG